MTAPARRARRHFASLALLASAALAPTVGCVQGVDAALVTVNAPSTLSLTHLIVNVSDGTRSASLMVPPVDGAPIVFPKTVSLSYPAGQGTTFGVDVRGYSGTHLVAEGNASVPLVDHGVTTVSVQLQMLVPDGGAPPNDASAARDLAPADLDTPDLAVADLSPPRG